MRVLSAAALLAALCVIPEAYAAPAGTKIAVLAPRQSGVETAIQQTLPEKIATGLGRTGLEVLDPAAASAVDAEAARCSAEACAGAAATALAVDFVVVSSIEAEGRDYQLHLALVEAGGGVLATVNETCEICGHDEILEALEGAAISLADSMPKGDNPATLAVTTNPSGASVRVDGTLVGETPMSMELPPGDHEIELSKSGWLTYEDRVRASEGVRFPLTVDLQKAPDRVRDSKRVEQGGYAAIGIGVAAAIAGAALMVIDGDPITGNCSGENIDSDGDCKFVHNTMIGGAALLAGGVAVAGTGVGLAVWGRKNRLANTHSWGVGLRLRF